MSTSAPAIQFADDEIRRVGPVASQAEVSVCSRSSQKGSMNPSRVDDEDMERDVQPSRDDSKTRQEFSGWVLVWLAYQSIGVIYGDIGTSPLYVYSSTFTSDPSYDDIVGAASLIIWTLTIIVTLKYVLIVLLADDNGEGGTFALYSLLSRYADLVTRDPKESNTVKMERYKSSDMKDFNKTFRSGLEKSPFIRAVLKIVGVAGVSLVMSDGILTPAQSVLGAIQGLEVAKPGISSGTIVGVSCAILVLLFMIQPLGTSRIASCFAPIVIIWLLFNLSFGIYNLVVFDHSVLKAFSPYYAGSYMARNRTEGWQSLGGILLAFTGVEATYAALGAFSRSAVRLSWLCFAYPCLVFTYIGQASYISRDPSAWSNPFFKTVPPGMYYPGIVISILAAIVASQAMITSAFQLLSQVMQLSYFPQIKLVHTSDRFHGQIYIPAANWLMMVGTIIVTAVYSNTTRLGHAYGVCVILVTFMTTCMVAICALIVWRLNFVLVFFVFLVFATFDGLFLSSALTKVPDGAWFTLVLAAVLSSIFILWRYGKEQQWSSEREDNILLSQLVTRDRDGIPRLQKTFGGGELTTLKGIGIYFDKSGWMIPTVFQQFVQKFEAQPEISVFFHMRSRPQPTVALEERYQVSRMSPQFLNCFRIIVRHGYNDHIVKADLAELVYDQLRAFLMHDIGPIDAHQAEAANETDEIKRVRRDLAGLDRAYQIQSVYIVGKEQMRIRAGTLLLRRLALNAFLWIRESTRSRMASMQIPVDKLVEVGFIKEV
ncbi:MAG: hypothetical protein M4579_005765 [Chaenotheca gracillima]|nr:MAG: hypothetical protein M4579_005765 [Chaenotheca gracillima]